MFILVSSKGGVGKSFVAKNLFLPYLVEKYGVATYINAGYTSDEDKLVKALNFTVHSEKVNPEDLITLEPTPYTVIDAEGGINTLEVLNYLARNEAQKDVKVVIVLSKRLAEINEAVKTYKYAKKLGFENFLLVLNKVKDLENYREEFFFLFSPLPGSEKPIIDLFEDAKERLILFPYDYRGIIGSFEDIEGRLPYDIYLESEDFIARYREKLLERKITLEDREKRLRLGRLRDIFELILKQKERLERITIQQL